MNQSIALLIPTFGTVDVYWAQAWRYLQSPLGSRVVEYTDVSGASIAEKRNTLAERALKDGHSHLFFLGDDVVVPGNTLLRMLERRRRGARVITGVYFSRTDPPQPYIFSDFLGGPCYDWTVGEFFKIAWSGCDCLMIDATVLKQLPQPWFSVDYQYGREIGTRSPKTEDLHFFTLMKEAKIDLWCDTSLQCGHVNRDTHVVHQLPPDWPQARMGSEIPRKTDKLVASVGHGYHLSYLDQQGDVIRYDAEFKTPPSVRCDVRQLPEPDGRFDELYAARVLECMPGRFTDSTLKEWARVLKMGGKLELRVHNLYRAAERIIEQRQQPIDFEILHGAQGKPHRTSFDPAALKRAVMQSGCFEVNELTYDDALGEQAEIVLRATKTKAQGRPSLQSTWTDKDKP